MPSSGGASGVTISPLAGLAFGLFGVCLETVSTLNEKVFALFSVVGFNSDLEPPPPPQQFLGSFVYLLQSCLPKTAEGFCYDSGPLHFPPAEQDPGGRSWLPKWATLVYAGA